MISTSYNSHFDVTIFSRTIRFITWRLYSINESISTTIGNLIVPLADFVNYLQGSLTEIGIDSYLL